MQDDLVEVRPDTLPAGRGGLGLDAVQLQAAEDVLMAEAFKLQVFDLFEREGHDRVLLMDVEALGIHRAGCVPGVDAKCARPGSVEMKADDLGIVETRHMAEPRQKLGATRNGRQNVR